MTRLNFANQGRRTAAIFFGLLLLTRWSVGAASLTLSGLAEGSQVTLAAGASATNLAFTANVSGVGGSPTVRFTLEGQGATLATQTAAPPYSITFSNLPTAKYFLSAQVATDTNVAANVSFDIVPALLAPANDAWNQAAAISSPGTTVFATNTFATSEPGESHHADNDAGHSVWWSWIAGASGLVTITTEDSGFDTVLAVYTGTNVTTLTSVAANDDAGLTNRSSQVSFTATAGTKYSFAVDSALTANDIAGHGKVQLRLLSLAPPSVAITTPTNGQIFISTLASNSVAASANIVSTTGLARVEFSLDGAAAAASGVLTPPYQWSLTNLPSGDYLLTVSARDTAGLITTAHSSFSIMSPAPRLVFVETPVVPAGFQFAVTGLKGRSYELQGGTNLATWNRVALWTNFDGALRVTDTNAAQFSSRYYRVLSE